MSLVEKERFAALYDREVLPVWTKPFGRLLIKSLMLPSRSTILDVACANGFPALELLRSMDDQSRIIALDSSSFLLDLARRQAGDLSGHRIFFKHHRSGQLAFAEKVFDLVYCNVAMAKYGGIANALSELMRVVKPGGMVAATLPLRGSFIEFFDLLQDALERLDREKELGLLSSYLEEYPTPDEIMDLMVQAGLTRCTVRSDRFTLLFRSSREFLHSALIQHEFLADWKQLAGGGQEALAVLAEVMRSIDIYYEGAPFSVTVLAGAITGARPT